jgi:hypothetical protein
MNHACVPNTTSVVTAVDDAHLEYGMKALRPIAAGEVRLTRALLDCLLPFSVKHIEKKGANVNAGRLEWGE